MTAVVSYLRMSTDHQRYSLTNQRTAIEDYCARQGLVVVEEFVDAGRSGLTIDSRPGLQELIKRATEGSLKADGVVVLDVSRWGRFQDADESAFYEFMLRRAGVSVIYCAEPFENDGSPASTIIKSVKRAMAAEYSRELSKKIIAGQRTNARHGYRCGGVAGFGLRRAAVGDSGRQVVMNRGEWKAIKTDRVILVPGPSSEVECVRRIFLLFVRQRMTPKAIAALLNMEGWPAPEQGGWCSRWVYKILRQEKYAGSHTFGTTTAPMRSKRRLSPSDCVIRIPDAFEAIVERPLFEAARALLWSDRKPYDREEALAALARLQSRYGVVTRAMIHDDVSLPSVSWLNCQFGSLSEALRLAGCPPLTATARRSRSRALRRAGVPVPVGRRPVVPAGAGCS